MLVQYYSANIENGVVEHLQSFHLGHAPNDELFSCIEDVLKGVRKNMIYSNSDGPTAVKGLNRRLKTKVSTGMDDTGECGLHKASGAGPNSFCVVVESLATDVQYYLMFAMRHADMKEMQ